MSDKLEFRGMSLRWTTWLVQVINGNQLILSNLLRITAGFFIYCPPRMLKQERLRFIYEVGLVKFTFFLVC